MTMTNAPRPCKILGLLLALGCFFESTCAFQSTGLSFSGRNTVVPTFKKHPLSTQLAASEPSDNNFPEVERPDPSILVSAKSEEDQKLAVLAIGAGIVGGTTFVVNILSSLEDVLPFGFLDSILGFTVPVPLGLLFALIGATHFYYKDGYAEIVPPKGAWGGLWQVPAPGAEELGVTYEEYHVLWTGVAEIGGGLLFALGGIGGAFPIQLASFLLFLLTLAVTPANVYMFTHDTQLSFAPPYEYPSGHIFRGVAQCVILAIFWYFTFTF